MPKHKKTRAQKVKADQRNQENIAAQQFSAPQYVFSAKNISHSSVAKVQQSVNSLVLIKSDLRKTALISFVIVLLQILFYFLLRNHVLAINFVRY